MEARALQQTSAGAVEKNTPIHQHQIDLDSTTEYNVGYKEYLESREDVFTIKEQKGVRWKIDLVILPIFLITQMLQFLDKTALNYANIFGYQDALGLKGSQFNYLVAMVYAGYFLGQYPGTSPCHFIR